MSRLTIHNPGNNAHFMRVKPVGATVRVSRGDALLAETKGALRVLETGRDVYDPVLYIPETDVVGPLEPVPENPPIARSRGTPPILRSMARRSPGPMTGRSNGRNSCAAMSPSMPER